MLPTETYWYTKYIKSPIQSKKDEIIFRCHFRLPQKQFLELLAMVKDHHSFKRWMSKDCVGSQPSPIELLLLGSLRYLGRGWTFDDLYESTAIHEETHRQFFHVFIEFGSTVLFRKFVITPSSAEEAMSHQHEFNQAGFHGAIGSTDATHVSMEKCPSWLHHINKGGKLSNPSRTYNLTVNHRGRILSTTSGHPARFNDKTLLLFDNFLCSIQRGEALKNCVFTLYEYNSNGNIVEHQYQGAWLISDNGYLRWSTIIPPFKTTTTYSQTRWSEWLESMRKDVECVFGIMKGRFRMLKSGMRLQSIDAVDSVWLTCCALHNWLLEVDGYDEKWNNGLKSDWLTELGNFEFNDVVRAAPNFALARLENPSQVKEFDTSGMGQGSDCDQSLTCHEIEEEQTYNDADHNDPVTRQATPNVQNEDITIISNLTQDEFRDRLVVHFDILFHQHKIVWPSR